MHCNTNFFIGSPHAHGVLFLDLDKIVSEQIKLGKLRFQHLQSAFATCAESKVPDDDQKWAITSFVDLFITCSLRNPATREIAKQVQTHNHTYTCTKMGSSKCRFSFPRFPSLHTIVAVPLRLIFGDDEDAKKKEMMKMRVVLHKVTEVLENKEIMEEVNKIRQDEIEEIYIENDLSTRAAHILEDHIFRKQMEDYCIEDGDIKSIIEMELSKDYCDENQDLRSSNLSLGKALVKNLEQFYNEHFVIYKTLEQNDYEYRRERLLQVLTLAKVEEDLQIDREFNFEDKRTAILEKYHQILGYSVKGFTVNLQRDTDECFINNFNHEWLSCWNANMDLSCVFDFYAILTYVR